MSESRFVFSLTEKQADALLETHVSIELHLKRNSPLAEAFVAIDEQRANQVSPWERCSVCDGSGWIEEDRVGGEQPA